MSNRKSYIKLATSYYNLIIILEGSLSVKYDKNSVTGRKKILSYRPYALDNLDKCGLTLR